VLLNDYEKTDKRTTEQTLEMTKSLKTTVLIGYFALAVGANAGAADLTLDQIAEETLARQRQVQLLEEGWSKEQQQLLFKIEAAEQQRDRLRQQNVRLTHALEVEQQRIEAQQRRLEETARLRENLLAWLEEQAQRLEEDIHQGLPFLQTERERRLADLQLVLADPYAPLYEQFRRVFEALLVEAEYGHSHDVYRDEIILEGQPVQVDLVRVGRLALFYRTLDRSSVGVYDPADRQFRPLVSADIAAIARAGALIQREIAPALISLPVGRIER